MSTWDNLDSSNSNSDEEANIGFMDDVADYSMSENLDNEVDFTDIDSLHLAYQEAKSNNGIIAFAYKTMKRNACKQIELMQQEKANLDNLPFKKHRASPRKRKIM